MQMQISMWICLHFPASNDESQNYVTSGVDVLLGVCKDSANEEVAKEFVSFMLEPENAKMYIDDQFAFSAVKGVEQENETVAGVKEDIASWQRLQTSRITTIHPDLICPHF